MGLFTKRHDTTVMSLADMEKQLAQAQERNAVFLLMIRALLYLIKEFSLDFTEIGAEQFKQSIDGITKQFVAETKTSVLEYASDDCKQLVLSYIDREKHYLQDRENEFRHIITLLSSGLHTVSKENQSFNAKIAEGSARLEKIIYLDDLRKVKTELQREVSHIKQWVQDKQFQDAGRIEMLSRELERLKVDFQKAQHASQTDGLTGVFNRAAFDQYLANRIERQTVAPAVFSLLMIDIDDFKHINDTYGHPVGDRVILAVAQLCKGMIRQDDFLARYGGEEFALILPLAPLRHALKKGRTLCKTIAAARYAIDAQRPQTSLAFTVSIGVSTVRAGDSAATLVTRADMALYEAKRLGKNRAVSEKRLGEV
jgi:diguanylate cyclase